MFILENAIEGGEKLLRSEVLAIVAATKTRLALPGLSKHRIVPASTHPEYHSNAFSPY